MPTRRKKHNENISSQFENSEYAQEYFFVSTEDEKMSIEETLREAIEMMGLLEFSKKTNLTKQEISDYLNDRRKFSLEKVLTLVEETFKLKRKIQFSRV